MRRFISFFLVGSWFLPVVLASAQAPVNVLTYHNDNARDGENLNETLLTPANVNTNTFGKLFSNPVDGYVYAQPLYVSHLSIPGQGIHNVVFIATEHNSVYAFDADANSGPTNGLLWQINLGPAAVTTTATFTNKNFGTRYNGNAYTDIVPEVGITGTPVIDLASGTLYVDSFTGEISGGVTNYFHRLHALNITNGTEQPYSPVLINASFPGIGVGSSSGKSVFNPQQQNQRAALTLANGIVYVAYAGYADTDPYHGWVIGFNKTNLTQLTNYVFNTTPNATTAAYGANAGEAGIWMGGGGLSVDSSNNLFFEVGNGTFTATNNSGGTEYGDSFMKLSTAGSLTVTDYFTPYNQANLALNDTDVGSGGLLLLPDQPGSFPHLLLGAGKQGVIYLINRDQMTTNNNHYDATGTVDFVVQTISGKIKGSFDTPAYFNSSVYYAANGDKMKSFSLSNGLLSSSAVFSSTNTFNFPGATPSISANGASNGVIWALQMPTSLTSFSVLVAYVTNLSTELYNSSQAPGNRDLLGGCVKFALPTVVNGKVYVGSQNSFSVFGLFAGTLAFNAPSYSVSETGGTATITVNRTGGTQGAISVSYASVPGGTAVSGTNYTDVSGTLNWADGDGTPKNFTVPILDSHQAGPNPTINLALGAPAGGAGLGGQSTATLTILEDPSDVWLYEHFGTHANNPAIAGDLADPTGDGIPNLLKYALAMDPNATNNPDSTTAFDVSGNQFQFQFHRNTSATDITCVVEFSGSLQSWTPLMTYTGATGWVAGVAGTTALESAPVGNPPDQYVNVTITDPTDLTATGTTNRFYRLEVHR